MDDYLMMVVEMRLELVEVAVDDLWSAVAVPRGYLALATKNRHSDVACSH